MNTIKDYKEHGLLSELAYLKLEDKQFKKEYYKDVPTDYSNNENIKLFIEGLNADGGPIKMGEEPNEHNITEEELKKITGIDPDRKEAMLAILDKYEIKEFSSDSGYFQSGFQGMLLQNKETSEYVIAFRGTAGGKDILVDIAIALDKNPQFNEAVEFTKNCIDKYDIDKDNLTLTGHSLGGILVQTVGSTEQIPGYAYNPLGSFDLVHGGLLTPEYITKMSLVLDKMGITSAASDFAKDNIVNISYNDTGVINGDVLSNFATSAAATKHMGQVVNIFGKNLSLDAHGITPANILLEQLDKDGVIDLDDLEEYNKKFLEIENQNSHEQRLKDWQNMTPEQKATAIQNGYGLGLSSIKQEGYDNLASLSIKLVQNVEENKEEKITNIENQIASIKSIATPEERLESLKELQLASSFDNQYAKELVNSYEEKLIENNGMKLDFIQVSSLKTDTILPSQSEVKEYETFNSIANKSEDNISSQNIG